MDALWRFLAYDALPLIAILVTLWTIVRVIVVLGPPSDAVSGILDDQDDRAGLHSVLAGLSRIRQNAPECGLTELSSVEAANREKILRLLTAAERQFWRQIRSLEAWTSASTYLTGILVFVTLLYAAGAVHSLAVGLSVEIEHNTAAIVEVVENIVAVVSRNTWIVFCLFVVNQFIRVRVSRRKDRWATLANRLTREILNGQQGV